MSKIAAKAKAKARKKKKRAQQRNKVSRLTVDRVAALAAAGVTRASLGVQDVSPVVQREINRHQSLAVTARRSGQSTPAPD